MVHQDFVIDLCRLFRRLQAFGDLARIVD